MAMIDATPAASPSATGSAAEARSGPACAACPHDRDAHDPIGARFCSATIARGLSRGCVCVGEALASVSPGG